MVTTSGDDNLASGSWPERSRQAASRSVFGLMFVVSSRIRTVLVYTAIFEKNMRNSAVNYLIPDWSTAVT